MAFFSELLELLLTLVGLLLVTFVASFYSEHVANLLNKCELFLLGIIQMVFSRDRKWKKPLDPEVSMTATEFRTKTVIFIRHGESEWNEVFNRGFGPSFLVRLFKALVREFIYLITRDSLFFDSPLSALGISQADALRKFLAKPMDAALDDEGKAIVTGQRDTDHEKSLLVTSNLRRAIATASIALQDRLARTNEKLYIVSSLQEISRNVDTIALALPHTIPNMHGLDKVLWSDFSADKVYDTTYNFGTKSVTQSNGMKRMEEFNEFLFERNENTIIVGGGHSLWFREYFRAFLPFSTVHECKNRKIANCGVVRFTVRRAMGNGPPMHCVEPDSVKVVYGGFAVR